MQMTMKTWNPRTARTTLATTTMTTKRIATGPGQAPPSGAPTARYPLACNMPHPNPTRRARNDSLAIQEQGLAFIRNLMMLPQQPDMADMVDYVLTELDQNRLFSILADKLKVRVVNAFGRRSTRSGAGGGNSNSNNNNNTLVLYPQARIVENLTYILVHIAAGKPTHRQLVVAQTDLLKLLGAHLGSKDPGVRRALCQLFANLAWLDNDGDRQSCAQRAGELERLGFLAKLEGLEQGDADQGVRERAKAAVAQMKAPTA
jgi:hypothetical protein